MDTEDPLPTVEEAVKMATRFAKEAKRILGKDLGRVWLHGSRSRGDHLPEPDLDILIEITEGVLETSANEALSEIRDILWMDSLLCVQTWFIEAGRWERAYDFQLKGVCPYAIRVL